MKFMLMCYDDEKAWERAGNGAQREAMNVAVQLTHELHAKGQYVLASPLEPAARAKTVRMRERKALVTDGPFAETREVLGGFYIVDVKDEAEALAIAARHPGLKYGAVEVRPILELEGLPRD